MQVGTVSSAEDQRFQKWIIARSENLFFFFYWQFCLQVVVTPQQRRLMAPYNPSLFFGMNSVGGVILQFKFPKITSLSFLVRSSILKLPIVFCKYWISFFNYEMNNSSKVQHFRDSCAIGTALSFPTHRSSTRITHQKIIRWLWLCVTPIRMGLIVSGLPFRPPRLRSCNNLFSKVIWLHFFFLPKPLLFVAFVVCLVNEARSFNGTLWPYKEGVYGTNFRQCTFYIYAPVGQQIQMTCSVVRITDINYYRSYLKVKLDKVISFNPLSANISPVFL